jgi:AcrR family transcriptional regulator
VQTVGIDRIISHAGVAKASLYNIFGSKEGLVRSYLESRHAATRGRVSQALTRFRTPRERLLRVFHAQGELFTDPGFKGCAFEMASAEAPSGGAAERAAGVYREWVRTLFTTVAQDAGVADPDALARQLHLLYDGAGLSARMDHDPSAATHGPGRRRRAARRRPEDGTGLSTTTPAVPSPGHAPRRSEGPRPV